MVSGPRGGTVSTLDPESSDRGSNPREAFATTSHFSKCYPRRVQCAISLTCWLLSPWFFLVRLWRSGFSCVRPPVHLPARAPECLASAWLAAWLQAYETCMEHDWGLVLCHFCPCLCQLWGWGHECCLQWILAHTLNHSGKLNVRCMFPTYLYIYHGSKCVHCACGAMLLVTSH